jgi:UDP-N-acetylmuramate dehydrogenase
MRSGVNERAAHVEQLASRIKAPSRFNVPLAPYTTFRVGGSAELFVEPRSEEEVLQLSCVLLDAAVPWTLLGGGSNVLIGDAGIRGVTVHLVGTLTRVLVRDDGRTVEAGAAANFARLTKTCMALGWPRSNGWVGTPGTVGGALVMNAGSRDGELGEVVQSVAVAVAGERVVLSRAACGFVYRNSAFPRLSIILSCQLGCAEADSSKASDIEGLAKVALQRRHSAQPKEHSAGSIFKNPPGDYAGRLIEQAGLKGMQEGGAIISPVHANFIVNLGTATAKDVVTLALQAQAAVQRQAGVVLEWEVKRIGEFL